jgi:uncharacterized protein YgiM (DUF1202 family)
MMKRIVLFVVLVLTLAGNLVSAQDVDTHVDTLVISWPPPVTEVWGVGDVLGTANIPDLFYYYLEYKPLNDDLSEPQNAPWIPATSAVQKMVIDGVLATLDTRIVADGLYSLRLTASTEEGQNFHYTVSPIRVDNARFSAYEARIRGEVADATATPTTVPTPVPADTTAKVTPSSVAVNIRRCDLIDNDRCPVIAQLPPNVQADITGRDLGNGWYQVRLTSGVAGWVSRSVILESGDLSAVPVVNPPAPLAPPVVQQPIAPIGVVSSSSAFVNGIGVQGSPVCNQPFNVQINVTNPSGSAASSGTIALQDVNVGSGTVTFSGSANYPAINPGGNFVVVIPVTTSVYYNEQHELRAYTNGQQFSTRYTLAQGNCGISQPVQPQQPAPTQRSFAVGECALVTAYAELSTRPDGEVTFVVQDGGTFNAVQVQQVGGANWYEINYADVSAWLPSPAVVSYQGNCGL